MFPLSTSEFPEMDKSISKLILNDSSVSISKEFCEALGQGWRLGFLGMLHMDVFRQRLLTEHNASVLVTSPTVPYKIIKKNHLV
jgi:translation elongation factor EF-4